MIFGDNGTPIIIGNETIYDLMTLSKEHLIALVKKQNEIINTIPDKMFEDITNEVYNRTSNIGLVTYDEVYQIINKVRKDVKDEYSK